MAGSKARRARAEAVYRIPIGKRAAIAARLPREFGVRVTAGPQGPQVYLGALLLVCLFLPSCTWPGLPGPRLRADGDTGATSPGRPGGQVSPGKLASVVFSITSDPTAVATASRGPQIVNGRPMVSPIVTSTTVAGPGEGAFTGGTSGGLGQYTAVASWSNVPFLLPTPAATGSGGSADRDLNASSGADSKAVP